jgi:hypothetical protein
VELSLQCHLYALGVIEETEALYLHNTRLLDLVSCFRSVICGLSSTNDISPIDLQFVCGGVTSHGVSNTSGDCL